MHLLTLPILINHFQKPVFVNFSQNPNTVPIALHPHSIHPKVNRNVFSNNDF